MIEPIIFNAIIASVIAAVAWLGSRVYHRPALWHAVWVIALLKLFVPPVWHISAPSLRTSAIPSVAIAPISETESLITTTPAEVVILGESGLSSSDRITNTSSSLELKGPNSISKLPWLSIAVLIWVCGAIFALVRSLRQVVSFHQLVRKSSVADAETKAMVDSTAASLRNSKCPPDVRVIDSVVPPLLWPVGRRPTVVLPKSWWQATSSDQQQTVLMHELVHWRRRDHWVRLLQWIASIAYWWHPVVWIANRELHQLEEQCCDAEVVHRLPHAKRSYASALVSVSHWLGGCSDTESLVCQPTLLAMPMANCEPFKSFHRRIEMLPTLRYLPWTRRAILAILAFAAIPLAIGLRVHAQQANAPAASSNASTDSQTTATLTGRITDLQGNPIADATVRVVVPATDLRFPIDPNQYREVRGTTDNEGKYAIDVASVENETSASIDVLHQGHRRLVGALMMGGDENEVTLKPSESTTFNAKLHEALYFAGQLVDEAGNPIEGATVFTSLRNEQNVFGVESTVTDAVGRFAVYSYESSFFSEGSPFGKQTAAIAFQHEHFIDAHLEKMEEIETSKRGDLRVVMKRGYSIGGIVQDADGTPAAGVVISISQPTQRKAMLTDAEGKFRLDGVNGADATLRVVDVAGNRKSIQGISISESNTDMKVELQKIQSPIETVHSVLGMRLTDVTTEINEAYDLPFATKGVMVVDAGSSFDRFEIGELRPGYVFWMVGNDGVENLTDMVSKLVTEAKSPTIPPNGDGNVSAMKLDDGTSRVRVVYNFENEGFRGTNTQYMKLTSDDIAELEALLKALESGEAK